MANSPLDLRLFPPPALGLALPLGLGVSLFTILLCRAAYLVRLSFDVIPTVKIFFLIPGRTG